MRHIRVAVPVPQLEALTYAVPEGHAAARRSAPASSFRSANAPSPASSPVPSTVPPRASRPRTSRTCSTPTRSCRRTSSRSRGGWPTTTRAARATRSARQCRRAPSDASRPSAFRTVRVAHLTAQGHEIGVGDQLAGVVTGERQREALTLLASSPAGLETAGLARRGVSAATLKRLAGAGLVSFTRRQVDRDPFGDASGDRET